MLDLSDRAGSMRAQLFAIHSGKESDNHRLSDRPMVDFTRSSNDGRGQALPLDERNRSGSISGFIEAERSYSGASDSSTSSGLLDTDLMNSSVFDTALLETNIDLDAPQPTTPSERWRRSLKLVQKGLAFSKVFRTLRDMSKENAVDPKRLSKIREAGTGAFATVDVCLLESEIPGNPPTQVAVKRLKYEALRHRRDLDRFFKEASMLRKLRHRYIAGYVGVGNFSHQQIEEVATTLTPKEARKLLKDTFIVQEYVPGGSLKDMVLAQMLLLGRKTYSDLDACLWMMQVAEGLTYLHSSAPKVVHRDLKLENILLRDVGKGKREAVLVDFGMSVFLPTTPIKSTSRRKIMRPSTTLPSLSENSNKWQELSQKVDDNLQRTDTAMAEHRPPPNLEAAKTFDLTGKTGSFMFMAPEVYRSQNYNEKADVFSFACIMYEVFARFIVSTSVVGPTGDPDTARVYAHKVARGYRRTLPKGMPLPLQHIITDCWAQEPQARPDMEDVLQRLQAMEASGVFGVPEAPRESFSSCTGCCIM